MPLLAWAVRAGRLPQSSFPPLEAATLGVAGPGWRELVPGAGGRAAWPAGQEQPLGAAARTINKPVILSHRCLEFIWYSAQCFLKELTHEGTEGVGSGPRNPHCRSAGGGQQGGPEEWPGPARPRGAAGTPSQATPGQRTRVTIP